MTVGELIVRFGADLAPLQKGMQDMQKAIAPLQKRLTSVGRSMSMYVTAPITAMGVAVARMGGDFQSAMNSVQAISGATGSQLEALRDQAKELGISTQFSASQAADAMGFLAMAGFDANQVLATMPDTLNLAAASGMDLAQTADVMSNIMQGYGLATEEAARASDVLTKAFTSSNTDLGQLAEAMKYAGPVASGMGVEFEEAAAAIGLMGNAGIQASMAGTGLRQALAQLAKPAGDVRRTIERLGLSVDDLRPTTSSLTEIIERLSEAGADTTDVLTIFGTRAGPAMQKLIDQGADALRGLTSELEDSAGEAARVAAVQMQGFGGAMKGLRSAVEGLSIAVSESGVLDFFEGMARRATDLVRGLADLDPKVLRTTAVIAGIAAAIGPLLLSLGALAKILPIVAAGFGLLTSPITLTIAALTALGATAWYVVDNWEALVEDWRYTFEQYKLISLAALSSIASGFESLFRFIKPEISQAATAVRAVLEGAMRGIDLTSRPEQEVKTLGDYVRGVASNVVRFVDDAASQIMGMSGVTGEAAASIESSLARIDAIYDAFSGRDHLDRMREQARALTSFLEDAYAGDLGLDAGTIAQYRVQLDALNVAIGETLAARARMTEDPLSAENFLPGLDDVSVRLSGLTDRLGIVYERAVTFGEAVSRILADDVSMAVGRVVEGVIMMEDGFRSLSDTLKSFGEMAQRVFARLIADITAAVAKAAVLRGIATLFGIGTIGSFGSLLRGALGFGGARAMGGPVMGGTAYLVGERGPELFVPPAAGKIIPNHALAGAGPREMTVRIQGEFVQRGGDLVATIDTVRRVQGY